MKRLVLIALALPLFATATAYAQKTAAEYASERGTLPPFLASMERHDITLRIMIQQPGGETAKPAAAGLPVGLRIIAGGAKVRDYTGVTDAQGASKLSGVPSNPEVQRSISYEAWVDYRGVRFPFRLQGVPTDGSQVELTVHPVTQALDGLSAQHSVEFFTDEESLVVRHVLRLFNETDQTVDLGALEGGGLAIPCPEGAKHPELHDEHNPLAEVRGTNIIYKGALLPSKQGPAVLSFIYTIPYKSDLFEWRQTLPIRTRGVSVATPQHKQPRQREAIPMGILTRGGFGETDLVEQGPGKSFAVFRSNGATLEAGQTLRFAITGLPAISKLPNILLVCAVIAVILIVVFGYRRREGDQGIVLSMTHLVAERDRLVKALARLRRAHDKGRIPEPRFRREEEAILARLVSVYRAIDTLEAA